MTRNCLILHAVLTLAAAAPLGALEQPIPALPAPTGTIVNIASGDVNGLLNACHNLQSNTTIVIAAGTYNLGGSWLEINGGISNVAIRGATGVASDVVIDGGGMVQANNVSAYNIEVDNAQNVTIADISIGNVYFTALQLNSANGCQSILCHDVTMYNTGEYILKANPTSDSNGFATNGVNNSTIEYCTFEYTPGNFAPPCPDFNNLTYSNGIDVHHGANWVVNCCQFLNMAGEPNYGEDGPAILFWNGSTNPTVKCCSLLNCQCGIWFGLEQRQATGASFTDCAGGIIENNMIVIGDINGYQDAAISVRDCPNTRILANTCIDPAATYMSAIEYRFTTSTGIVIENNITDNKILDRDGATASQISNNITDADDSTWYVNPSAGNLKLTSSASPAFFAGMSEPLVTIDWSLNARPVDTPDIGADQYNAVAGSTGSSSATSTATSGSGGTSGSGISPTTGGGGGNGGCGLGGGSLGLLAAFCLCARGRRRQGAAQRCGS
jgi:hypothetical protein